MSTMNDFPSRIKDASSRRFGTFSYLPPLTQEEIRKQIQYILKQGWDCAIEHCEPEFARLHYWYLWKLPMFGETDVDVIMREIEACQKANPGHHVRLIGYNKYQQTQGLSFLVHRAEIPPASTAETWLHLKTKAPDWVLR
jgi:ribulose-bisphosphate carboxylase small chain